MCIVHRPLSLYRKVVIFIIKLIFKKISWAVVLFAIISFSYTCFFLLMRELSKRYPMLFPGFPHTVPYRIALFGVPFVLGIVIIYLLRRNSKKKRSQYLNNVLTHTFTFREELCYIVKSNDFVAEMLACMLFSVPVIAYLNHFSNGESVQVRLLASITMLFIIIIAFLFINIPLWLFTHKAWIKRFSL